MPITKEERRDSKIAQDVLERLLPDVQSRKVCLRFLCESIQLAHQLSPSSWGVTLQKDLVRLNVGQIEAMTIKQDRVHVVFARDAKPPELQAITDLHFDSKAPLYKSVERSSGCDFPASKAGDALPPIREFHHRLIKQAAKTPRHNMTAGAHSPGVLLYLDEELGISSLNPDYSVKLNLRLSALTFQSQFERFKVAVVKNSAQEFRSFREGLPLEWEGYKEHVRTRARTLLKLTRWEEGDIGTGRLLDRVIRAIEINEGSELRNNLVGGEPRYGPSKVPHRFLKEAQLDKSKRTKVERAIYDLFQSDRSEEDVFQNLHDLGGMHYEVLAYLFFLKDWDHFMPIRTKTFDAAFLALGLDLRTTLQCSWENYCDYNEALQEVLAALRDITSLKGVRLIDAHSFCWMLVRMKMPPLPSPVVIPLPKVLTGFQILMTDLATAETNTEIEFDTVDEKKFDQRDAERQRLGRLAQDIAMQSEMKRLREAGHPNPEEVVRPVWDEPGRGYDILSCERDGTLRYIEVKAARQSGEKVSFFMTQNEWTQSRSKTNYCFYLIFKADSTTPIVQVIESRDISPDCLIPINYVASFRVPGD